MDERILEYLPHRPPMLLLDEVITLNEAFACCAQTLTGEEYWFEGHFPGRPLFPGALQIEGMAQTAAIWMRNYCKVPHQAIFAGVEEMQFRKMLVPPAKIRYTARLLGHKGKFYQFACEAYDGAGTLAAKGNLTIAAVNT